MPIESTLGFRLTVWRPVVPRKRLAREAESDDEREWPIGPETTLYEEVYAWSPRVDVWSSVADTSITNQIRQSIVQRFDPFLKPDSRNMHVFKEAVDELSEMIQRDSTQWSDCDQTIAVEGEQDFQYRTNTVLALLRHFEWIHSVFKHLPGVSVTVR